MAKEIRKVPDGFSVRRVTTKPEENGEEKEYVPTQTRIAWAHKLAEQTGCRVSIRETDLEITEISGFKVAIAKATVLFDDSAYEGIGNEFFTGDFEGDRRVIGTALTKAVGRALNKAGFSLAEEEAVDEKKGDILPEAPVSIGPAKFCQEDKTEEIEKCPSKAPKTDLTEKGETIPLNNLEALFEPEKAKIEEYTEEEKKALEYVWTSGAKFKGLTLKEIYEGENRQAFHDTVMKNLEMLRGRKCFEAIKVAESKYFVNSPVTAA